MQAKTLNEIYSSFKLEPLNEENYAEYFVETDSARGVPAIERIKRRLDKEPEGGLKILFAGYRGCGKSTELERLRKDIESDYIILSFSVFKDLDIQNINYIELFIVAMERLVHFVSKESKIEINPDYVKIIEEWAKSIEIESSEYKNSTFEAEAGSKVQAGIPLLAQLFAIIKSKTKQSTAFKKTFKEKVEPRLSEFIQNCNLLINEIKSQLGKIQKKGLIIVFEDLDKVPLKESEEIFYQHYTQLNSLNCHCIFTYPIALVYHHKFNTIKNSYGECFILPMIKIFNKDGSVDQGGLNSVTEIVKRRMDLDLFENKEIIIKMIKKTGGCLRDLFRMIIEATDNALDSERVKIYQEDYDRAYESLKSDYRRTIAENKEMEIKSDEYYEALKELAENPEKKADSTNVMLDLRNNLCVLQYNNGDEWNDVHPIVMDILKDKRLIGLE